MAVTEQQVLDALRTVQDPELFKDLVTLNMIKGIKICEGNVSVDVELTTPACPLKDKIKADVTAAVAKVPGVTHVEVNLSGKVRQGAAPPQNQPQALPGVKNIIAVGAGKGGVGKSTIAVNLAVGLAMQGAKVGVLDGDIYGPSIPTLTGLSPMPPMVQDNRIQPFAMGPAENPVKVMSIGFMVDREKALIWRGPMAHGAIKQFLEQVAWGELDYLIVDLPPGTGDVSLTLAQTVPLTGAVIVATPQEVALSDARRAVRMFQQLGVDILGLVENMSYFVCEHGTEYDIFGRGGAQTMAQEMGLAFLGQIPIDMRIRIHSDAGTPYENFSATVGASESLRKMVQLVAGQVSVRNMTRPAAKRLTLQVS
jgi:ATP-binding protein involved in chromosome partitioning